MKKRQIRFLGLVLLGLIGCARPLPVLSELPEFSLQNQFGEKIGKKDLLGKVWIADFIFTGCADVCPLLTQKMGELQKADGILAKNPELRFVSFSVDPENDTPERLREYGERFSADGRRWFFLTGPLDAVQKTVEEGFKIGRRRLSSFEIVHGDRFVLVDSKGRVRGYYEANTEGMKSLTSGAEQLLGEGRP